jgi:hypothetical protein
MSMLPELGERLEDLDFLDSIAKPLAKLTSRAVRPGRCVTSSAVPT